MGKFLAMTVVTAGPGIPEAMLAQFTEGAVATQLSVQDGCVFDSDSLMLDFSQFQNPASYVGDTVFVTTVGTATPVTVRYNLDTTNATLVFDGDLNAASNVRRSRNTAVSAGDARAFAEYRLHFTVDRNEATFEREIGISTPLLINRSSLRNANDRLSLAAEMPVSGAVAGNAVNNTTAGSYRDDLILIFTR